MPELPSGAVTFLFTDIEGSTRLLKQLRERYGEVLNEHQRLLRAAFEAHRGHEVDTQGDSFFVAFASARDALLAAVEGQLALLSHTWPEGVQIKVRMGLHTGQAIAAGGRYTGLAVHRAARIGAAGHGGQILVSQATQTLLEDEEEDLHVFLRDLGEQRLKDLDRAVRLYQATADGLPASFAPLRAEAELAHAAQAAIRPPPLWRRPVALAAAALVLVGVLAVGVFYGTRDSVGASSGVGANSVVVIDPKTNELVAEIPVGIRPGAIAVGDGAVWVAHPDEGTVSRIDPETREVVKTIGIGSPVVDIAVGSQAVWTANGSDGTVSRIDPRTDVVVETFDLSGPDELAPDETYALAVGTGSLWIASGASVLRIDPDTGDVVKRFDFAVGAQAVALDAGGDEIWVATTGERALRIEPRTNAIGTSVPIGFPYSIATTKNSVWIGDEGPGDAGRLWQLNSVTTAAVQTIPVQGVPGGIAVAGESVWVASNAGSVLRVDPGSGGGATRLRLGHAPFDVAAGEGGVWISVRASSQSLTEP
jgi:YVTN family beta-propeller protein